MPVPLTNACFILATLFAAIGANIGAIIVGSAGLLNQAIVVFASPPESDEDGLG